MNTTWIGKVGEIWDATYRVVDLITMWHVFQEDELFKSKDEVVVLLAAYMIKAEVKLCIVVAVAGYLLIVSTVVLSISGDNSSWIRASSLPAFSISKRLLADSVGNKSGVSLHQHLFDKQLRPLVCTVCTRCICLCQSYSLEPVVVWWYNSPLRLLPGNRCLEQQVSLESSHEIWMSHSQLGKGICWRERRRGGVRETESWWLSSDCFSNQMMTVSRVVFMATLMIIY